MRPLRWRVLAVAWGIAAAIGAVGSLLALRDGATPVMLPKTTLLIGIVLGLVVLGMAWSVRQFKLGNRKSMDPAVAVRTAMLSQASAYSGALLFGMYGGYALVLTRDSDHLPRRDAAIAAGLAALGGLAMLVAGVVGEWWCRIKPGDDDPRSDATEPGGTLAT